MRGRIRQFVLGGTALLLSLSCSSGDRGSFPTAILPEDLLPESPAYVEGFYARSDDYYGPLYVNAFSDSLVNGVAVFRVWNKARTERFRVVCVFDLSIRPDSTVGSVLLFEDAPDTFGTIAFKVEGTYSFADSFAVEQVYDSTLEYWVWRYEVRQSFRVLATLVSPKIVDGSIYAHVGRIGPHREATIEELAVLSRREDFEVP